MTGRVVVLVLVSLLASPAIAGDDKDEDGAKGAAAPVVKDPQAAKTWHAAAKTLVQKGDAAGRKNKTDEANGHYENALIAYGRAIDASDDIAITFELAVFADRIGKLDVAATHYRVVIADDTKPDLQKKATAKYQELADRVGFVALQIDPEGTTVSIAGAEIGKSPLSEPIVLAPGTYTVSFASDGYQPKDVEIKVEAGSEAERRIELEPLQVVMGPVRDVGDTAPTPSTTKPVSKLPLYVGGGAAVAALGVTVITGILAVSAHGTFTAEDSTSGEREDARSSGETYAVVSDVSLVLTLAAAGFTAYWYVYKYRPSQEKQAAAKVGLVPWVKSDAGGLSAAGSF